MFSAILLSLLFFLSSASFAQTSDTKIPFGTSVNPDGERFEVDATGFMLNGKHLLPVMGEIHYSRVEPSEWRREIRKMKAGGITIISTYVFWSHHEAEEGMWNWSGNCNLRAFLQICKEEHIPIVLRLGPFCHGEVYLGGFPLWLAEKAKENPQEYKLRTLAPGFMSYVEQLYGQIALQTKGMLWKDGGPVVGVQIENECRGPWNYYMRLRNIALNSGFDVPFMTRTGWPKLNGKEEFGKLLPLYGDYADGFWDRKLTDMPGDYPKAFIFKDDRMSRVIATETFSTDELSSIANTNNTYPYLTCELGGGMMPSYHRRINMSGNEALPLAICKLGSGSNLPGYYMYHGGSNKYNPEHTMAECQASLVTNYNDMPHISYDFQAPLGEMGQPNWNAFHQTRWLHQFLADWGSDLASMDVDSLSEHYARRGSFVFRNDYVRILNEEGTSSVTPLNLELSPSFTITSESIQPFAKTDDTYYFITIKGKNASATINGRKYSFTLDKQKKIGGKSIIVLSPEKAKTAYVIEGKMHYAHHKGILYKTDSLITEEYWQTSTYEVKFSKLSNATAIREIKLGSQKVAEQPSDSDFNSAALYSITIPNDITSLDGYLEVNYKGDCARLYADGTLIQDNFWNGKPMLVRLSQIVGKHIEFRILPLRKDAPIYLQKQQKAELEKTNSTLMSLDSIVIIERKAEHQAPAPSFPKVVHKQNNSQSQYLDTVVGNLQVSSCLISYKSKKQLYPFRCEA